MINAIRYMRLDLTELISVIKNATGSRILNRLIDEEPKRSRSLNAPANKNKYKNAVLNRISIAIIL